MLPVVWSSANKKDVCQKIVSTDIQQKGPETSLHLVFDMTINKYEHIPEVMAARLHQELQRQTSRQPAVRIKSHHTATSKNMSY